LYVIIIVVVFSRKTSTAWKLGFTWN